MGCGDLQVLRKKGNLASFAMRRNRGASASAGALSVQGSERGPRDDDCIRGLAGATDLTFRVRHSSAMSASGHS